ncbi:uncharacterized protein O3C94_019842 [Discoglossus pictus]
MSGKKAIVVFGATGAQGGSVAKALLGNPNFSVKAVTRDVKKPAAVALQKLGAEVVCGDLNNKDDIGNILKGAYGAFVVTNFDKSKEDEVHQGKLVADLAKSLNLKHVVYSGLENVKKTTGGKLEVSHFDGKGEVEEHFWKIGVPMTSVRMAFYFDNFLTLMKPKKAADGNYELVLPMEDVAMDGIAVADIGPVVVSLFCGPDHYIGKAIGLSAERLTAEQYAEKLSKHIGKPIKVKKNMDHYMKAGLERMANMFRFYHTKPDRNIELTHKLNPNVKNFDQFLSENQEALKNISVDSISKAIICQKAKLLHVDLVKEEPTTSGESSDVFNASHSRFDNFKKRTGIHSVVRQGEAASVDKEADKTFVMFRDYVDAEAFILQQLFNCNETGLFLKKMRHTRREDIAWRDMACKKIIAVFGATGAQGGSVVNALLEKPNYIVRAVTRDVKKPAAVALQKRGAEVVQGNLNNKNDIENILKGAHGAFVVTNFWDDFSKDNEVAQGKLVADVAKSLNVKHVVYSGLEDVKKLTGGKLEVLHFDGKGEVEEYFWKIGVPMTSVRMAFYFENFITMMKPVKATDGDYYNLYLPMKDIPMDGMSVADIGPVVSSLFCGPDHYIGKAIGLSSERLTAEQYAEKLSKHIGKTIKAKTSAEEYESLGFPGVQEMVNMFRFYWMKPDRDIELTHKLNPGLKSFDQFLCNNKEALKNI